MNYVRDFWSWLSIIRLSAKTGCNQCNVFCFLTYWSERQISVEDFYFCCWELVLTSKKVLCLFTAIDITRRKLICVSKITVWWLTNLRIVTNVEITTSSKDWSITRGTEYCMLLLTFLDVGNKWSKVVFVP